MAPGAVNFGSGDAAAGRRMLGKGRHTAHGTRQEASAAESTASTPAAPASAEAGLTSARAAELLADVGANALPEERGGQLLRLVAAQLTHLLALLLWVAAGLALLAGMPQLAVAIVVIVVLNAGFAVWQEHRADRSAQKLRTLMPNRVQVVRDGTPRSIDATELVPGDLVLLAAGDRVAADMRVHTAHELRMDESLVTGESRAVPHSAGDLLVTGSFVVQGAGQAQVTATGAGTTLAEIAVLAQSAHRPPSPLTVQLDRVVRVVAVIATGTGVALGLGAVGLGLDVTEAFLFGVGVTVALVPEGLLPTVTLSLARGAQLMAREQALVRRLDAVETLGATTYICTDKTGTLTQNTMQVVDVVTVHGPVQIEGAGYEPVATVRGPPAALADLLDLVAAARSCVTGQVVRRGRWVAEGDPMEAAIDCLAQRVAPGGRDAHVVSPRVSVRRPFTPDRLMSSAVVGERLRVLGAPEAVFDRCVEVPKELVESLDRLTRKGRRVVAVATRQLDPAEASAPVVPDEEGLVLLGLLGIEDPPRPDVAEALQDCRTADIRIAMLTGDHVRTARAIAEEIGLLGPRGVVRESRDLPADDAALGALLDAPDGMVVARVTPADKFRIARVLRERGHVVAMTGDGVNDAPALREADVGVAMGASGSDVAREAADLVLLDDHFGTIVTAVRLGRATFQNVRRFLTYHLTDNVAELAPFAAWALTGGQFPLAIGVLQVLALDIGTDMLPALALGAEPANPRVLRGRHVRNVVDRALLLRAVGVLGATEAVCALAVFAAVLVAGGWAWGDEADASLLATASGTAFAVIAVCQMANAFACRSASRPVWRMNPLTNPGILLAVAAEAVLLVAFLGTPFFTGVLGGTWPGASGWVIAAASAALLLLADGAAKRLVRRTRS
jgi:magnesium-transporting ATPase (P-type)